MRRNSWISILIVIALLVLLSAQAFAQGPLLETRILVWDGSKWAYATKGMFSPVNGAGTVVTGKCTAAETGVGMMHQTTLTFTLTGANDLDLADGNHGTGVKVYDFPAGRIMILGATINATVVTTGTYNASTDDVFLVSMGTAVGADDAALTSTEVDIIPATTLDTVSNTVKTLPWGAALAATAQFDGTSTAKDVYVNAAIATGSQETATTYAVTGTATITWINLGDY